MLFGPKDFSVPTKIKHLIHNQISYFIQEQEPSAQYPKNLHLGIPQQNSLTEQRKHKKVLPQTPGTSSNYTYISNSSKTLQGRSPIKSGNG